jgi:hypothetical protein
MVDRVRAKRDIWYHDLRPVFFGLEKASPGQLMTYTEAVAEVDEVVIPAGSEGTRVPGTTLVTFEITAHGATHSHGCHPPHYCIEVIGSE